jgi:hypothetical protein
MRHVFGLNYFIFCILVLVFVLFCTKEMRDEGFDNTGALVQLAASRVEPFLSGDALIQLENSRTVNTIKQKEDEKIYNDLKKQGIINMTESAY